MIFACELKALSDDLGGLIQRGVREGRENDEGGDEGVKLGHLSAPGLFARITVIRCVEGNRLLAVSP